MCVNDCPIQLGSSKHDPSDCMCMYKLSVSQFYSVCVYTMELCFDQLSELLCTCDLIITQKRWKKQFYVFISDHIMFETVCVTVIIT